MTQKGYTALQAFVKAFGTEHLACVVCARDPNVDNDYYEEIRGFCQSNNISFMSRRNFEECGASYYFAISWKWMMR